MEKKIIIPSSNGKKINLLIVFHLVLFLIVIFYLLPTDDDWGYLVAPKLEGFNFNSFLPNGSFWRPIDAFVGLINNSYPILFPFLNHLLIGCGFLLSIYYFYKILKLLGFEGIPLNVSISIFIVSPAVLGTVLGIDSINQMYSVCFGLIGIYHYLRRKYLLWIIVSILAVFSKENGIVYFVIPPFIGYLNKKSIKEVIKHCLCGGLVIIIYMILRFALQVSSIHIEEDSPYAFTLTRKLTDIVSFVVGSTSVVDFISLIHKPSRNIFIVVLTFLVSALFLFTIFKNKKVINKEILILTFCMVVAASPHLATHFGPMHAYSTIPYFCLIVAFILHKDRGIYEKKLFNYAFILYVITAVAVDWHHWYRTYESSKIGPLMAKECLEKTEGRPQNVLCISIKDEYPRFSSFCVPPRDVFHTGSAVLRETGWTYPKKLKTLIIEKESDIKNAVSENEGKYDCIWIQNKYDVTVINKGKEVKR